MTKCDATKHNYQIAKSGYYKLTPSEWVTYDQTVAYAMLFCTQCGDTKEVVSQDHRREGK